MAKVKHIPEPFFDMESLAQALLAVPVKIRTAAYCRSLAMEFQSAAEALNPAAPESEEKQKQSKRSGHGKRRR